MKHTTWRPAVAGLVAWFASCGAMAGDAGAAAERVQRSETWAIAEGGKLYDNWAKVLYFDTSGLPTHPLYPAAGKQAGATTWRCKECHGWDYRGKDGSYAKGSHFTGIKGLRAVAGQSVDRIAAVVRGKEHGYTAALLPDGALAALALFVSRGQVDVEQHIDRTTRKAKGDAARGARFYQTICAVCHGFDGKAINFGSPDSPEFIGTVAVANPWETLHKIRNGQPGVPMVSLGALEDRDIDDILAYTQTLPEK